MIRMTTAAACATFALAGCSHQGLFRSEAETGQKIRDAQPVPVAATVARAVPLRAGPDGASPALAELPEGTQVTAAEAPARGFRRVKTADGRSGYVLDGALRVTGARAGDAAPGGGSAAGSARDDGSGGSLH
jgi:hypothetical protein